MDKSPDAFRTISEVAEHLETPAHVLRFWESRFPQIRPVKRAGGRRYYRPSDVSLLTGIKRLLHDEGMTIRGVQKILREQGVRHVSGLSGDVMQDVPEAGFYDDMQDAEVVERAEVIPRNADPVPLRPTSGLSDVMAKAVDHPTPKPAAEPPATPIQGALLLTPAPSASDEGRTGEDAVEQDVAALFEAESEDIAADQEAPASAALGFDSPADDPGFEEDEFDEGPVVTLASRIRALPEGASVAAIGTEFLAAVTRLQALRDRMAGVTGTGQS